MTAQEQELLRQQGGDQGAAPPPPTGDPMQDPGFRAFVAQRAQQMQELKDAQAQAASRRDSTSFRLGNGLMAFGGAGAAELGQRYDQAGQPVKDVLARQEAERASTEGATKEVGLAGEMQKSRLAGEGATPGSKLSQAHAMLALHQGLIKPEDVGTYTAAMDDALHKGATIQAATLKARGELAMEKSKLDEETRHHKVEESFLGQKDIPPSTVTELESKLDAVKALDDLKAQKSKSGVFDKVLSWTGLGGDYDQTKNAVAAEVAKSDAKGRSNPSGAVREKQLLPGPFQNDTGIDQKRQQLIGEAKRHLAVLKAGRVRPDQVAEYERQIGALEGGGASPSAAAAPAGDGAIMKGKDGNDYRWNGKAWEPK